MRQTLCVAFVVLLSTACGTAPTREVQGQLAGLNTRDAVVVSETRSSQFSVARVSARGTFVIEVPTGQPARLVIAHANGGALQAGQHIGPHWFKVPAGSRIDLGVVRRHGSQDAPSEGGGTALHLCPARSSGGSDGSSSQDHDGHSGGGDGDHSGGGRADGGTCNSNDSDDDHEDGDCDAVQVSGCATEGTDCDDDHELEACDRDDGAATDGGSRHDDDGDGHDDDDGAVCTGGNEPPPAGGVTEGGSGGAGGSVSDGGIN